ncbi:MAG TPA: SDR family oxidoreductase [Pseudonocardia sp.]|nr:SDR family oxidoreductase [Pseudonocardia sp.]
MGPEHRRTVVTGAASGIGRATVELLRREGDEVLAVDVDPRGQEVADACGARFVRADVSDPDEWARIITATESELGGLDLLFLNAGVPALEPDVLTADLDRLTRAYGVNVGGVLHGLRAGVPLLERDGGGDLLITASLAGIMPYWSDPLYSLTKHAAVGLARSVARPLGKRGVRVNLLCPGVIDTPITPDHIRVAMATAGLEPLSPAAVAGYVLEILGKRDSDRIWLAQPQLGLVEYVPAPVPMPAPVRAPMPSAPSPA